MLSTCMDHFKTQPFWVLSLSALGFLSLSKLTFSLLKWVFIIFFRPPKNLKKTYGSWALITGSTDGIGKAISFELARMGLNLILVSRNTHKLNLVADEIRAQHPETKINLVAWDFTGEDTAAAERVVAEAVEGLDVGVLVNNVGITYPAAMFFHEVDEGVWRDVIRVNMEGTTRVTRAVIPGMIERKRGAVVNIGSGAGIVVPSHPLYAMYAATKAYVDQLSRCLYVEYKHLGIDVQCQVPLYVATKLTSEIASIDKTSFFVPSAERYAKSAISRIGYEARCTPYWTHSVQWFLASLLPETVLNSWRLSIGILRRKASLHPNSD